MAAITPYLTFDGTCEAAFLHYKSVFGGEFPVFSRFKDTPSEGDKFEGEGELIMHVSLPIGADSYLMGSDRPKVMGPGIAGNNFSISVNAKDEEDANKIYSGLSEGGTKTMPMAKTFWGAYFGMLTDKFGIQWMVNYDYPAETK